MFSLCGYNVRMFKALTSADVSSDMIVDTYSASLNAHIAPLGKPSVIITNSATSLYKRGAQPHLS
jgi:hypothetical protein